MGNPFLPTDLVNLQIIFRGPLSRMLLSAECLWMLQPAMQLSQRQENNVILLFYSLQETFGQEYTFFFNIEETSKNQAKCFEKHFMVETDWVPRHLCPRFPYSLIYFGTRTSVVLPSSHMLIFFCLCKGVNCIWFISISLIVFGIK